MRHRMSVASMTGLGNPNEPILTNNWPEDQNQRKIILDMMKEAIKIFRPLEKSEYSDFNVFKDNIVIGNEPAYMYEELFLLSINRKKESSMIRTGVSFGNYGSNIVSKVLFYKDKKRKSKFVRFVDKYHALLYGENNGK